MPSGGRRAGAGRKPDTQGVVKVQMVLTIYPETRDKLKAKAKACNTTAGAIVDMLLKNETV